MTINKELCLHIIEIDNIILILGDCLEVMDELIRQGITVDAIIADIPYGRTNCEWDIPVPFPDMWRRIKMIRGDRTPIVLFGIEPFSSALRMSNLKEYKYDWVWRKDKPTNHLNAKKMPMRRNENISVFYKKQCLYKPQLCDKPKKNIRPPTTKRKQVENYGNMTKRSIREIPVDKSYPNEQLNFRSCFGYKGKSFHPTQKPVDLMKYLILTYTNEGDTVLDFTMGSGSTGCACLETNRKFIGIEKMKKTFDTAIKRIARGVN